jgi:hypothetical protein
MAVAPGKRILPLTDAQQEYLQQFRQAVLYAKSALADPVKKAEYQAAARNSRLAYPSS